MRTVAVERACAAFEAWLAPRLGAEIALDETRVAFDATGWSVTCRARAPGAELALRIAGDGRLTVAGASAWRTAIEARVERAGALEAARALRGAVGPQRPRREPLTGARARVLFGDEGALIAGTVDAFARAYGAPLEAVWLEGDETPSLGFPPVVEQQEVLLHAPPPFRQDAHTVAYLEDLGFAVDARDRVAIVPLPRALARRRARLGVDGGLAPALREVPRVGYSPRAWLAAIASEAALPINVHGALAHALSRALALPLHPSQRARLNDHFHALGHDVGVHALALHRVPAARLAELRRLARVALARGRARQAATFFEGRLTRACVETWARVAEPRDFEPAFEDVYPTLRTELATIAHA
ncbi:MAG: hypothetical protein KF729_28395 [Sandaracinaceae bacterium]|nr:hypothetical protein [Sandaracinaceae bacterium]